METLPEFDTFRAVPECAKQSHDEHRDLIGGSTKLGAARSFFKPIGGQIMALRLQGATSAGKWARKSA